MEKIKHKPYGPYEKYIKRPLDLICSLIAIIVFSWLYLIIAILVRVKLGSPVIFTQDRPGKDEKIFKLYKFRTMIDAKDENGNLICPNGRKFIFKRTQHVKYNKYGRTEELYECESCERCPYKQECCPKAHKNRTIRMNQELTAIHQEILTNLECIHGALLRMNRSIQSEEIFGILKWDKSYKRLFRRGEKNVILELTLISCGFNLYKYHNKKQRQRQAA